MKCLKFQSHSTLCGALLILGVCGLLLATCSNAWAQAKQPQPNSLPSDDLSAVLNRRGNVTLRDTSITDAMFVLRKQWDVDMVISASIDGTVNAVFTNATLREILDSLLLSRGFGYRAVGRSIVILPLDQIGALKPLFDSEVVTLKYANPNEMKEAVELLLSPHGKVMAMPSTKSLLVLDYPDRIKLVKQRIGMLDLPLAPDRTNAPNMVGPNGTGTNGGNPMAANLEVRVFRPQYVKIDTLQPAIDNLLSPDGRVALIANEDQIMVADRPEVMAVIEEAVLELDQPRPQVRIWALIYDCSLEDVARLGVNWNSGVFSNGRQANGNPRDQLLLNALTAAAPPAGAANGALTLMSVGRNVSLTAIINALQTSKDSKLLADPNVTVMNHEPAKIQIVTEVPYQQLTQGIQGGTIGTTAFREAGVTLEVTPHIARDQTISMIVNPRFSVLTGFTENDEQPIIDRREAKTTVRVTNGETFVLGGLRQKTKIIDRSGIPGLQDVKFMKIGKLFQYKAETLRESELLVFITPEIVPTTATPRPREDAAARFGTEELDLNRPAPPSCKPYLAVDPVHDGGPGKGIRVEHMPVEIISSPVPNVPVIPNDPNTPQLIPDPNQPGVSAMPQRHINQKDPPQSLVERLKGKIQSNNASGSSGGAGNRNSSSSRSNSGGNNNSNGSSSPFNFSIPGLQNILPGPAGIQPMKGERPAKEPNKAAAPGKATVSPPGRASLKSSDRDEPPFEPIEINATGSSAVTVTPTRKTTR